MRTSVICMIMFIYSLRKKEEKMKRRLLGLILVGAMIFSLSACGKNEVQQESDVQQEDNVYEREPASDPNDEGDTAEKEEVKLTSTEMTDITFTKTDSAVIMNISGETFQIFQQLATKNDTENPQGAIAQMDFHFWNETDVHYYVYVAYIGHGQYACLEQEFDKKVHNDVPFEMTETGISVSLTPELADISNLGLFGVNIQSKDESYYVEDLYAFNVDGKLMVTKESESIATNDAMLQVAEQNNKQAVDQGEVTEENVENNSKQIWVTLGDIEITEMPIARSVLEDDGWTIEISEVTNICRTTKDNNVIGVVLSEDKTMITSMTICNDENSLDHTIEEDLLVLLFGTVPVLSASKEDVISIMDSEETGEYRDHSLSETNWGLEFGNPDKCIGFVAANKDSKYFMITLISK